MKKICDILNYEGPIISLYEINNKPVLSAKANESNNRYLFDISTHQLFEFVNGKINLNEITEKLKGKLFTHHADRYEEAPLHIVQEISLAAANRLLQVEDKIIKQVNDFIQDLSGRLIVNKAVKINSNSISVDVKAHKKLIAEGLIEFVFKNGQVKLGIIMHSFKLWDPISTIMKIEVNPKCKIPFIANDLLYLRKWGNLIRDDNQIEIQFDDDEE